MAEIRLTGTKEEIDETLNQLAQAGFTWLATGKYYQRYENNHRFSYYLIGITKESEEWPQKNDCLVPPQNFSSHLSSGSIIQHSEPRPLAS